MHYLIALMTQIGEVTIVQTFSGTPNLAKKHLKVLHYNANGAILGFDMKSIYPISEEDQRELKKFYNIKEGQNED